MRVVYLHQHFTTREGSVGTRSYEFAKFLAERGHDVFVITGINNLSTLSVDGLIEHKKIDGINVIAINVPYSNKMSYSRRIFAFLSFSFISTYAALRVRKPDVIFATSTPLTIGIPGYIVSRFKRIPFVFELRDLWPDYAVAYGALKNRQLIWLAERLECFLYRKARKIVTICETIKRLVADKLVSPEKLVVIPIGADVGDFKPGQKDESFRRSIGIGDGDFVVSYVGAHSTVNALNLIVDCANLNKSEDLKFLFVGDGKCKKDLIEKAGKNDKIVFRDSLPRKSVPQVIQFSDLCVVSAIGIDAAKAILPNKFFDYISCGKPVIINFEGELADLIRKERIGMVVDNDDPQAMLNAIIQLKKEPELLEEMGSRARSLAIDRFDRKKLAEQFEQLLLGEVGKTRDSGVVNR